MGLALGGQRCLLTCASIALASMLSNPLLGRAQAPGSSEPANPGSMQGQQTGPTPTRQIGGPASPRTVPIQTDNQTGQQRRGPDAQTPGAAKTIPARSTLTLAEAIDFAIQN